MENLNQIREVSTLSFNERVLQEAEDKRNPLMERLKFLGIFSSNMDEFFKVRVASIHRRLEYSRDRGLNEILEVINHKARELDERFRDAYDEITQALSNKGLTLLQADQVDTKTVAFSPWLTNYFRQNVLPFLVPIILQPHKPFPQLVDSDLYFGVIMWSSTPLYAILKIPSEVPRFIELPDGYIMYIDDVIRHSLDEVFYIFKYDTIEAFEFKISRDAELDIDNDFSEGHVRKMEQVLKQRKGGRPTRLVYDEAMPKCLLGLICREMNITEYDTLIPGGRYHNMKDLKSFPTKRKDLAFEKLEPVPHPVLDITKQRVFDILDQQDILVTYPYQSFDHVIRFLREAAIDPEVDSIQATVYRTADRSQFVNALINAARNGKRVFVSVELQARFDEKNNIAVARKFTEENVQVGFGVPPMKVHSKLLLITRGDKKYAVLSTGNFNEATSRAYVDSALLTADPRITREVGLVFQFLERASRMMLIERPKFKHLLVSPFSTRLRISNEIAAEEKKGKDGYIFMKVNHLTDKKIIRSLRRAADAGVRVDLVVRTTYAVLPHPNIRAISILDRFLEHQRVYIFGRGDQRRYYLSSADMMERNLDWRVEVCFPLLNPDIQKQVDHMMTFQVADTYKARVLDERQSNGYLPHRQARRRAQYATRQYLLQLAKASRGKGRLPRRRRLAD